MISQVLQENGFEVLCAASAVEMDTLLDRQNIGLVLLDIMLPGEDGMGIRRRLRDTSFRVEDSTVCGAISSGNSMVEEMTRLYPRSRRPECKCYCGLFRRPPVMAVTFVPTAKVETFRSQCKAKYGFFVGSAR
jgi:CheY-like chemotaxis protein